MGHDEKPRHIVIGVLDISLHDNQAIKIGGEFGCDYGLFIMAGLSQTTRRARRVAGHL